MPTNLTQQRLEQAFAASGLTQAELARSSGVGFGIVAVFTLLTWLADSGFGALAAFFLGR